MSETSINPRPEILQEKGRLFAFRRQWRWWTPTQRVGSLGLLASFASCTAGTTYHNAVSQIDSGYGLPLAAVFVASILAMGDTRRK